jgi:phage gp29-like protein
VTTLVERAVAAWHAATKPPKKPRQGEVSHADPSRLFPKQFAAYNPDELVARKGYRVYDEMRRDDQVKAALTFKKQSVIASGWEVYPPEGKDDEWEPAAFLEESLKAVEGTLDHALTEVLTALDYGFSVTEKVWTERDGKIVLQALKTRHPHEWELQTDEYGNLTGLRQVNRDYPKDKFVVYTHEREFGNWYGHSDLNAAYRPWWTKKNAYQWMAMLLERMGIPPIFALYNPEDYQGAQTSAINQMLRNLQAATVGSVPRPNADSLEMWAPELAGQVSTVFIPAFEMFNKDISRALLMPGLIGMTDDSQQGSLARSEVHFDVFMLVLEFLRRDMQELMREHVVELMMALNFPALKKPEYPTWRFRPLTSDDREQILTTWGSLVGSKVVTPQDQDETHVRELLKFPELDQKDADARAQRATDEAVAKAEAMPKPEFPPPGAGGKGPPPFVKKNALDDDQFEALLAYAFDPDKHPRYPAGDERGGQFAPKDEGGDAEDIQAYPAGWETWSEEKKEAFRKRHNEASKRSKAKRDAAKKGLQPPPPQPPPPQPPPPQPPAFVPDEEWELPLAVVRKELDVILPEPTPGVVGPFDYDKKKVAYEKAIHALTALEGKTKETMLEKTHNMAGPKLMQRVVVDHMEMFYERTERGRNAAATLLAVYGRGIPPELTFGTTKIVLTDEQSTKDVFLSKQYNKTFVSAATGGDGRVVFYKSGINQSQNSYSAQGKQILAHELSHNLSRMLYGNTQPPYDSAAEKLYQKAKKTKDWRLSPSDYGMTTVGEYYAEAIGNHVASGASKAKPELAAFATAELDKARREMVRRANKQAGA